jgi:hypothetical protein
MAQLVKSQRNTGMTNLMEDLAGELLEDLLSEYKKVRFTHSAKQDIKALALNRLWPMYTTTSTGRDFLRKVVAEDQVEKDVVRELRAAIELVRSNPRD